jgi:hypothetical protein
VQRIPITVQDMSTSDALRPLTGGVPLAKGAAQGDTAFALHDDQGNAVPLQAAVRARWEDGSARWVLLDFQAQPPVRGKLTYTLAVGGQGITQGGRG